VPEVVVGAGSVAQEKLLSPEGDVLVGVELALACREEIA
jgi:hypothetical protein